jgi:uncharacterized repeat protein (TIGR03803 family)
LFVFETVFVGTPNDYEGKISSKIMRDKEKMMNSVKKSPSKISGSEPEFRSMNLATAMMHGAITLAVLSALLLIAAPRAQAQTNCPYPERVPGCVLYNFSGLTDGANPGSSLTWHNGKLYGTTTSGGLGYGTVFMLTPDGNGDSVETTLYSFCPVAPSCADGQNPTYSNVIFDSQGNIYGTAYAGGEYGYGVVFELSLVNGTWTETVLHSFANAPDAANPVNGLIMDKAGNLYGTAYAGGTGNGNGAVYELSPSDGSWTEQVIYDINSVYSGLTMNAAGNIFGTTYNTIFELVANGSGGWKQNVIYTFAAANAATEGSYPNGTLALDTAGNLYGTAMTGGKYGYGAIYKLTLQKSGLWTEKLLTSFGAAAEYPFAGPVFDSAGNLYGTTTEGGQHNDGTVWKLTAGANNTYSFKTVQYFGGENGNSPDGNLVLDSSGNVYGTTYLGGASGLGTVFEVNPESVATTMTVTSSPNPSVSGEAVTFTAVITSSAGAPPDGETVTFDKLGPAVLTGGTATFTVSNLPVGTTEMYAVYFGDLNFRTSKSPTEAQVVNK